MLTHLASSFALCLLMGIAAGSQAATSTWDGTCSDTSECVSGCCSSSGYCGFGPSFCGDDVCVSTCDAVAECGPYAEVANTTCPLNVCCSQYGFCGTTEDFCDSGCQSGCDAVTSPSCSGTSSDAIYAGYYEAWNYQHPCDNVLPPNIDVTPWTHLYYAFAGIDSSTWEIESLYANDEQYWAELVALKKKKSVLKTFISVGGWDFGGKVFSDLASFPGSRKTFINSAISFMEKWGFDGIDIDWEYPAASDRDGKDADTENFVTLMKELKAACGSTYGITATLPSSYWYMKGFDIVSMAEYVDHFNFMAYDIHGTWDGQSNYTSSVVNPHTNLTEISEGLDLLWRNNIEPSKVLLGLGFYGRSFTLSDSSCNTPGCAFDTSAYSAGGGAPGECTESSGILSDYEINRIIDEYSPTIEYDETAAVNWITWESDQWVSFDNAKTLRQKANFANEKCLGGLFGWALDLGGPGSLKDPNNMSSSDTSLSGANTDGGSDGTGDFYVGQEIFSNSTVVGIAPINMVLPPSTLGSTKTYYPGTFTTSIEFAWEATGTAIVDNVVTVTTTITRTVVNTTITVSPIETGQIPWWNWNITSHNQTHGTTVLFPSFVLDPIPITNPFATATVTSNRSLILPPWPWSTTDLSTSVPVGPTIHFTQGDPPSPTCTAGCGTKCTIFCDTPCMDDCTDSPVSGGFDDPSDPDPPSHEKCAGPDCKNDSCDGSLCVSFGCTGSDCDSTSGECLGSDCEETGCMGDGCSNGSCTSTSCQTVGCSGSDCNGSGLCFGLDCISLGCIGLDCIHLTGICSSYDCHKVSCSGPNCNDGICEGDGCETEDTDCESEEADVCTEFISSWMETSVSTYTTTTSTSCGTITACYAEATTITSTMTDSISMTTTPFVAYAYETDSAYFASIETEIDAYFSSMEASYSSADASTTTSSTTSSKTSKTSKTSTTSSKSSTSTGPSETSLDNLSPEEVTYSCKGSSRCKTFAHLHSFCVVAKSYIRGDDIYGTLSTDENGTGECYTDGKNAGFGCGVFVKGTGCQLLGTTMQAAFDHIFDEDLGDCKICGQVEFSNGCHMKVDYVSGCETENNGLLELIRDNVTSSSETSLETWSLFTQSSVPWGNSPSSLLAVKSSSKAALFTNRGSDAWSLANTATDSSVLIISSSSQAREALATNRSSSFMHKVSSKSLTDSQYVTTQHAASTTLETSSYIEKVTHPTSQFSSPISRFVSSGWMNSSVIGPSAVAGSSLRRQASIFR